ncbi:rhombosortase [Marinimicrobium sp. C6131]|uniref:rhombosortase n=1 Tax=Marinimicrobium sp. C6131 TaxID=3022676 RepID=UPI00223DBA8F|nr:rhombosortase [Marinimicrobium sp. C6131]UZJ46052.1 rhombosortase [Marinimicrobium sp. C6131]
MPFLRFTPSLWLTLGLSVMMVLLGALQSVTEPLLELNRDAVAQGELWRLLTGHWIHYGPYHLAMNLGAFMLCGWILFQEIPLRHYGLLLLTCLLGVGIGIQWFNTDLDYYAGLSGALHGLLVAGVILTFKQTPWMSGLALAVVTYKIVQEQWPGYDTSHELLPVPVAVDAHLYGAVIGLVWGVGVFLWRTWRSSHV